MPLQHVTSGASRERPLDFDIAFGRRHHDDACLREFLANGNHRVDAAHIGEPDIHKGDVGMEFAKAFKGLAPAGRPRPTTQMSGWLLRRVAIPSRKSGWSSTLKTRIGVWVVHSARSLSAGRNIGPGLPCKPSG